MLAEPKLQGKAPLPYSVWLQFYKPLEKQGRKAKGLKTGREARLFFSELPPQVDSKLRRRIENLLDRKEERPISPITNPK